MQMYAAIVQFIGTWNEPWQRTETKNWPDQTTGI